MDTRCELCGCFYGYKALGERCQDMSWYEGIIPPKLAPTPCPGRVRARVRDEPPMRPYRGRLAPVADVEHTLNTWALE